MITRKLLLIGFILFLQLVTSAAWALKVYRTGSAKDVFRKTQSYYCLAGGGSEDLWAQGWKQLLRKSRGGDIVIIRTDGQRGGYEKWIYEDNRKNSFPKVNSVTTLLIEQPQDANKLQVKRALQQAELIFFAGGYQNLYIDYFKGTQVEALVQEAITKRNIPVGGTSAGMSILGGIDYTARYSSPVDENSYVSSEDVLKDPTGFYVDLDDSFLVAPFLQDVVTETHFRERNRQGRLMGFMARSIFNHLGLYSYSKIKGIGADEGTAMCYGKKGIAQIFGSGSVFFLEGQPLVSPMPPSNILEWFSDREAIRVYQISAGRSSGRFDLKRWKGSGGTLTHWYVNQTENSTPRLAFDEKIEAIDEIQDLTQ